MLESEKLLERKLNLGVKKLGGWSIKLLTTHVIGLPDRMILLPGGRIFFAEIKTTHKKPAYIQHVVHNKFRALGFKVYVLDSTEDITQLLDDYGPGEPS